MPRTGASYYLPSPPMPLVPGSLAAAEDVNTVYSDIATALTNSLPTDGSAAMVGNLNMNGHSITGTTTLSAATFNATSTVTTNVLNATGGVYLTALLASVNGNNQNLTGLGTLSTNGNATIGGTLTAYGGIAGYYSAGTSDGRYLYKSGDTCTGTLTVNGTLTAGGTLTGNGNGNINGTLGIGSYGQVGSHGWFYSATGSSYGFQFWYNGNVVCRLNSSTDIALASLSDANFKQDIQPVAFDGLAAIKQLQLFKWRWKDIPPAADRPARGQPPTALAPVSLGFVAQQVEQVFPEAVWQTDKNRGVSNEVLIAALCRAVQQIDAKLTAAATLSGAVPLSAQRAASPADRAR